MTSSLLMNINELVLLMRVLEFKISSLKLPFYKILLEKDGKSVTSYLLMNINKLVLLP